jgi:hypothetical protein
LVSFFPECGLLTPEYLVLGQDCQTLQRSVSTAMLSCSLVRLFLCSRLRLDTRPVHRYNRAIHC